MVYRRVCDRCGSTREVMVNNCPHCSAPVNESRTHHFEETEDLEELNPSIEVKLLSVECPECNRPMKKSQGYFYCRFPLCKNKRVKYKTVMVTLDQA